MLNKELIAIIQPQGEYELDWRYGDHEIDRITDDLQSHVYNEYHKDKYIALFNFGATKKTVTFSESMEFLYEVSSAFVKCLTRNPDLELLRENIKGIPEEEDVEALLAVVPFLNGEEYLDSNWITGAWDKLNKAYILEISKHKGSVSEYFLSKNPNVHFTGKVYFHLVENNKGDYPFAFLATYAAEPSVTGKAKHLPLKNALMEYGQNSKKLLELLSTVYKATRDSQFVSGLLESGEIFYPIGLNVQEAYIFLKEVPLYESAGILCRIPNWWRKKSGSAKMSIRVGTKEPSKVGMDALLNFDVVLSLGGEQITAEDLKKLLSEPAGLAFIKGKWEEADPDKLREVLKAYEKARKQAKTGAVTMFEAMRMQMSTEMFEVQTDACEVEVLQGEWLESVLSRLKKPETGSMVSYGENFQAVLREYQKKGVAWLYYMKQLGLGACLADDMGLGKTVQVIALLNYVKSMKDEKVLLVVPASLIGNWTLEISKFAPKLVYYIIHPQSKDSINDTQIDKSGIYITTYGMLSRSDRMKEMEWDTIILDEAQAIKNPGTKQTRAVKQLTGRYRIAMTGTPVENRLSDLWSIFDFLNKGLLGSPKEFSGFTKRLIDKGEGYTKLKQIVSPFILRRLKTDKSIIADLPEKIEMKTYSTLSKKQAALYGSLVEELKEKVLISEGIERKGLVLAALVKFKQICNHPDQYIGQAAYIEKESGKFERLREICETIYEKRERVIVFTQFREITEPLSDFLETVFHHKGLVLNGETPVAKRKEIVAKFQDKEYAPFMVLSIKAGGVGLNLTAANHVIHFDRWWNPAVENQATDRAFRIGQKKNVLVHKFITKGTVEEKIDRMIEEKVRLTNEIMPDINESWITEMDNTQLMNLFRLE